MTMDVDTPSTAAPPGPSVGTALALSPMSRPYGLYPESLVSTEELPNPTREWAYEMRHKMQYVARSLWLGSSRGAKEFQTLHRKGVTHV